MNGDEKARTGRWALQGAIAHALLPLLPDPADTVSEDADGEGVEVAVAADRLRSLTAATIAISDDAQAAYHALVAATDAAAVCPDRGSSEADSAGVDTTVTTHGGTVLRITAVTDGASLELRCKVQASPSARLIVAIEDELESPVALLAVPNWREERMRLQLGTDISFDPLGQPWQIRVLELPPERVSSEPAAPPGRIVWLVPAARRDPGGSELARVRQATRAAASGRTRLVFESPPGPWTIDVETYAAGAQGFVRLVGNLPRNVTGDVVLEIRPDTGQPIQRVIAVEKLRSGLKLLFSDLGFDPIAAGWCIRVGKL